MISFYLRGGLNESKEFLSNLKVNLKVSMVQNNYFHDL